MASLSEQQQFGHNQAMRTDLCHFILLIFPKYYLKHALKYTDVCPTYSLNAFQWQDKEITCLIDSKGDLPF